LFLLPAKFWLRRMIFNITFHSYFEYFIIFLILVSSVLLCLDSPFNDPDSLYSIVITYMNQVITICFIVEAGMKILSLGLLFNGTNSYLRSISNCSDFLIVAMSSLDLFMSSSNSSVSLSTFKVIRILRILRPLKIISRSEGLSLAMNSLINSLPSLLNLQIIIFIVFLLFGIFGVN
jgi:voltage-dependent calcium channel T type alpha-1G